MLALVALGLGAWGLVVRSSQHDAPLPGAAPTPGTSSTVHQALTGPPPWVRYRTPLEGRWVAGGGAGKVTLVVQNAYVDVWQGVGQRQGQPSTRRLMIVVGDEVHLRAPGDAGAAASYRWRIAGDRLTFEHVDESAEAVPELAGLAFVSAR